MSVRIGVVGAGNIGTAHAQNIAHLIAGATVSMVFDADRARAAELADSVSAGVAASFEELIASGYVDAIIIASPDDLHPSQALACLAAGKPTMCEKPLAPVVSDALAVMEAEVALGHRLIQMGFMRRFDPGYLALKEQLRSKFIGVPLMISCAHRNATVGPQHTTEMSLTNSAVHEMDITRWLLEDEIVAITVLRGAVSPRAAAGLSDPLLILMESSSGILTHLEHFSNCSFGYDVTCSVTGSEGVAELGNASYVTTKRIGRAGVGLPAIWTDRFNDAYVAELQAFVDGVATGSLPGPSLWDGYVASACTTAGVESLRTGARAEVTLVPRPALYA
mgnify:CR=1 FL=1